MDDSPSDKIQNASDPTRDLLLDFVPETATAWSRFARTQRVRRGVFGKMGSFRKVPAPPKQEDSGYLLDDSPDHHSIENFLNVEPPTLNRRALSQAVINLPPKPLRQFRRFSSVVTSTSNSMRDSSTSSMTTSSNDEYVGAEWNDNPDFEPRKKIRARRKSIQGTVAPVSSESINHIARSAEDWKRIERSPPQDNLDHSTGLEPASPARSVASSRKRGVGGSPIFSDLGDDMSSTGNMSVSNNSRSTRRNRIFSPEADRQHEFMYQSLDFTTGRQSPERERNIMDLDSDADGEHEDDSNGSQNLSFESSSNHLSDGRVESIVDQLVKSEMDVLETMSSFQDLRFTLASLRKEKKKQTSVTFAFGDSWTLAPKHDWSQSRRNAFLQWATQNLGFSIRSVGGSGNVNYLQISRTKGNELLEKLEAALTTHQRSVACKQEREEIEVEKALSLMDMSYSAKRPVCRPSARSDRSPFCNFLRSVPDDEAAADLTSQMEQLGFDEKPSSKETVSSGSPLVRHVTLEAANAPSRPSLDHHFDSKDMMFHIHGHSPVHDSGKPPRMSMASVHSYRASAPFTGIAAAPSFDIIETPLMKQDDNWGSCPVEGRDWGASERGDDGAINELTSRFEDACRAAGAPELDYPDDTPAATNLKFDLEPEAVEVQLVDLLPEQIVTFEDSQLEEEIDSNSARKRKQAIAKRRRMSVYFAVAQSDEHAILPRSSLFQAKWSLGYVEERDGGRIGSDVFPYDESQRTSPFCLLEAELEASVSSFDDRILSNVFSFLTERELLVRASSVCSSWADLAASSHAGLMLASVRCLQSEENEEDEDVPATMQVDSIARSMQWSWDSLNSVYPWGRFLSEGGMKKVYMLHNTKVGSMEAVSVMDVERIMDKRMVGAELAITALLSSLARRGICPNFIVTHGIFTSAYEPPASRWGSAKIKAPLGDVYVDARRRNPPLPKSANPGRFQCIRMELCNRGDCEEIIKLQPRKRFDPGTARSILFQSAFALYAGAERYSFKHYDVKLLNIFIHQTEGLRGDLVLRYGLGCHVFAIRMPKELALVAKLADYGTANVKAATNGQPVTIAQFTTLENTAVDFLLIGDLATQGHAPDCFQLGLAMLHLYTGNAPYEELLADVRCPPALKKRLRAIWEDPNDENYSTVRNVVLADVFKDEAGHISEGEPDETLYDTLYRIVVLFGIADDKFQYKARPKVWDALVECLEGKHAGRTKADKPSRCKNVLDSSQYSRDRRKFSVLSGSDSCIARARKTLESMDGGLELLFSLCNFDPTKRASAMDVLNSSFMQPLREIPGTNYGPTDTVRSYCAFST